MNTKSKVPYKKITLNMPVSIYKDLQKKCKEFGTNTTTQIIFYVREGMKTEKAIDIMPELLKAIKYEREDR